MRYFSLDQSVGPAYWQPNITVSMLLAQTEEEKLRSCNQLLIHFLCQAEEIIPVDKEEQTSDWLMASGDKYSFHDLADKTPRFPNSSVLQEMN